MKKSIFSYESTIPLNRKNDNIIESLQKTEKYN